jgi:putative ABC transport system substrate-binding protein
MRRRDVLQVLAGAALAAPCGVAAQVTAKTFRLAALSAAGPGYMAPTSPSVSVVIKVLAERGYKLGQNLEFQPYGADMQVARLAQLASDIAASKFDAVIVAGYPAAAAKKAPAFRRWLGPAWAIRWPLVSSLAWRAPEAM